MNTYIESSDDKYKDSILWWHNIYPFANGRTVLSTKNTDIAVAIGSKHATVILGRE